MSRLSRQTEQFRIVDRATGEVVEEMSISESAIWSYWSQNGNNSDYRLEKLFGTLWTEFAPMSSR